MGRGPRQEKANYSASNLLFGPRRARPESSGAPSEGEIVGALKLLKEGQPDKAIDLFLRLDAETAQSSPAAASLVEELAQAINTTISDNHWQKLISGLNTEIKKYPNSRAYNSLSGAISHSLKERVHRRDRPGALRDALSGAEREFLFTTDHFITEDALRSFAAVAPEEGLDIGTDPDLPENKRYLARQGVYHRLLDQAFLLRPIISGYLNSPILSDAVLRDLADDKAPDLVAALNRTCQENGGYFLLGSDKADDEPIHDLMLSRLLNASTKPRQKIYKNSLDSYLNEALRHSAHSPTDIADSLDLSGEARAAVNHFFDDWRARGPEDLPKYIFQGGRSIAIEKEKRSLANVLSQHISLDDLNKLPAFRGNHNWKEVHKEFLERSLVPDRKVKMPSANYWAFILEQGLVNREGNPFNFTIDPASIAAETRALMEK